MNDNFNVYECSDGRVRAYNKETKKIISYPRLLMAEYLGRPLEEYEDVHHIDGNPLNNKISNLEVVIHGKHQKLHSTKYFDIEMKCPWCNITFVWDAKKQRNFYSNQSRRVKRNKNEIGKPFCSKRCIGAYSRQEQLKRNLQAECGLNGEPFPNGNAVPNTCIQVCA